MHCFPTFTQGGQCGAVVTHSSPTFEVDDSNPGPYVGSCLAMVSSYSTEPSELQLQEFYRILEMLSDVRFTGHDFFYNYKGVKHMLKVW